MARVLPSGVSLANLDLLMRSLEFIEDHLEDTVAVQTEDIAAACYASKSALEKVFKYTIRFSVHDYIIRRKMTRAARMMIEKPALSILDIAVQTLSGMAMEIQALLIITLQSGFR